MLAVIVAGPYLSDNDTNVNKIIFLYISNFYLEFISRKKWKMFLSEYT